MNKRFIAAFAAIAVGIAASLGAWAQGHDTYTRAMDLFGNGMYSEAMALFKTVEGSSAEAYAVICALKLGTDGCIAASADYLEKWPESILASQVRFQRAVKFFGDENYEGAANEFRLVGRNQVEPSQVAEYTFKKGYSAFATGDIFAAEKILMVSSELPVSDYTAPTWYSLGFLEYSRKNFITASQWFEKAAQDPRFTRDANYYILECRFMEKDYDYVVSFGEDLFDKIPEDRQPHMARLMSESYFILSKDSPMAGEYTQKANEYSQKIIPSSRSDYFYLGTFKYSALQDWQGAVDNFNCMVEFSDSLGQLANYQMGYSYIQLRNKVAALDSFRDASKLSFDKDVQEDAMFNYAKLAFDINHDSSVFREYLAAYSGLNKGDSIYSYMAMAALSEHDYEAAVEAYDKIERLDPGQQSNYMKAYFLRACQLIESGSWRLAAPLLKYSAYYSDRHDPFNQLARYWQAESCYRDGKYKEARGILNDLYNLSALDGQPEGNLISYHLAYTYFMDGDYQNALRWFDNYIESDDEQFAADAMVRVGDCYFFQRDYSIAITAYELKIGSYPDAQDLYPYYRAGLAAGLLEEQDEKIRLLSPVKSASSSLPYWPESMYELGKAYASVGDTENAVRTFRLLRTGAIDPDYTSRALLELGTISRSKGEFEEALSYYKTVVEQGGHYVEDALLAIESIYSATGEPEAYLEYLASVQDIVTQSDERREAVYFSAMEQIYLANNWTRAISTLQQYMIKFPEGAHMPQALFYLAESYRNLEDYEKAADSYVDAIDAGIDGALLEQSWLHLSGVRYRLERFADSYAGYQTLLVIARLEDNKLAARRGMMRAAFRGREYPKAVAAAEDVLKQSGLSEKEEREATYILAKSCLGAGMRDRAMELLAVLAKDPSTGAGAEASYLLIQDLYDRGHFSEVPDKVYEFAPLAVGQNYWLAKAYIVLGDSFMEMGNAAQAKATFQSLLTGYTPFGPNDDVLDQVRMRLSRM
ncbi:MAG: tetratricopeptide repeat protein [Bacteroidales bacterium]|nr:tetratricopeptide repeat protein [Bacteroidales bacterium]